MSFSTDGSRESSLPDVGTSQRSRAPSRTFDRDETQRSRTQFRLASEQDESLHTNTALPSSRATTEREDTQRSITFTSDVPEREPRMKTLNRHGNSDDQQRRVLTKLAPERDAPQRSSRPSEREDVRISTTLPSLSPSITRSTFAKESDDFGLAKHEEQAGAEEEEDAAATANYLKKAIDRDTTGRSTYLEVCALLGIVPVKYFIQHLPEKNMIMRHHGLGDAGMTAISKALRHNITIEILDLTGNGIGETGGVAIGRLLRENEFILRLILADNMLRSAGAYPILSAVQINNSLRVLNLNGNQIGDDAAPWLGLLLEHNKALVELDLSRNDLGDNAAVCISTALASNDRLEALDLSWNKIRGQAAVELAKGIRDNVRLKRVNLSWNGFGASGGNALANMLVANDTLWEVDVSGNRLDDKCAQAFTKVFSRNENLRALLMGYNPISTTGMVQMITALRKAENSCLEKLDLSDIKVEFEFLRVAKEIKMKRPNFTILHGAPLRSGNTPSDIGKLGLDPRLDKHPLLVLKEHILVNDMRFLDTLRKLDVQNKLAVTRQQFEQALKELGINYSKEQMREIGNKLDKQKNGLIYYGDLIPSGPKKEPNLLLDAQSPATPHNTAEQVGQQALHG